MRVFVTGGSGFLGQRIISTLNARGHLVLALARSDTAANAVVSAGAQPVRGDLASLVVNDVSQPILQALQQVDAVIHAAAPVVFWAPWRMYQTEMIDATRQLAQAAVRASVKRFIYISSESVMQSHGDLCDIDESFDIKETPCGDYGKSKLLAEQALLAIAKPNNAANSAADMQLTILRPTFIWGEGVAALQTMQEKVRAGKFAWIDHGQTAFEHVHVDNAAHACELALHRGSGVYLLTNDQSADTSVSIRRVLQPLIEAHGVKIGDTSIPGWLARPMAATVESIWRATGAYRTAPPLTRFDVAFMSQPRRYKIDKIKIELGYKPLVSLEEGLERYRMALNRQ